MQITPITTPYLKASQQVVAQAFAQAPHASGDEAQLVARLRQSPHYNADYDVIALMDKQVVGAAMLSRALVGTTPIWVLGPLAVLPDYQGQGIGGALISYLEVQAGEDERRAISILGDPDYYQRFGYQPAQDFGITAPMEVEAKYFLIKELFPQALHGIAGQLQYDPAFGI